MSVDYADVLNLQTLHELAEATAGELTPISRASLRPLPCLGIGVGQIPLLGGPGVDASDGENLEAKLPTRPTDLHPTVKAGLAYEFYPIVAISLQALEGLLQGLITVDPVADGVLHGLFTSYHC